VRFLPVSFFFSRLLGFPSEYHFYADFSPLIGEFCFSIWGSSLKCGVQDLSNWGRSPAKRVLAKVCELAFIRWSTTGTQVDWGWASLEQGYHFDFSFFSLFPVFVCCSNYFFFECQRPFELSFRLVSLFSSRFWGFPWVS
jgi:hypothetical protein